MHIQELAFLGDHKPIQYASCATAFKKFYFELNEIPMVTLRNFFKLLHYKKKGTEGYHIWFQVWPGIYCFVGFKESAASWPFNIGLTSGHQHPTLLSTDRSYTAQSVHSLDHATFPS